MYKNVKGKQLATTEMKSIKGGAPSAAGCRTDVCTRTQGCCPGLVCALLPQAGTNIRGNCVSLDGGDA
jgi:hypothetical protein